MCMGSMAQVTTLGNLLDCPSSLTFWELYLFSNEPDRGKLYNVDFVFSLIF